jgi:hypothetical protein
MYPYHLGIHLKTGKFCRILHPAWGAGIPQGFGRVTTFKYPTTRGVLTPYYKKVNPYTKDGELRAEYWAVGRWTDILVEQVEINELDCKGT